MKKYIKVDAEGYIWGTQFSSTENITEGYIEVDQDLGFFEDDILYRYVNGEIVATDKSRIPPAWYMSWNSTVSDWTDWRDLQQKKDSKWEEIKSARSAEEFSEFNWNQNIFQCDEVSQRRIQGAVQLASLDANFTIDWTLANNTVITLSAQDVIDIGVTLAEHVNDCHLRSRILREDIEAATTEEELLAIVW
jgi:hypothetical protein